MADPAFAIHRHTPPPALRDIVVGLTVYEESGRAPAMREVATLRVPLIVSLGAPFRIAFARDPSPGDMQPSFAAGLFPGPVHIESDGGASCVQADLHPLQAFRVFGGALAEIAGAMVPADAVFGRSGAALIERCGNAPAEERPRLVAEFLAARLGPAPSAATCFAWGTLARSAGAARIETIAAAFGISRTLLSTRFRAEVGVSPKTAARMIRFAAARRLARSGRSGWADIALAAGYADQAHLVREFTAFAGEPPTAWARRAVELPIPSEPA